MDYFDCDYFVDTYFDTPDCGTPSDVPTGHRVILPTPSALDEADELLAVF